MLLFNLRVALFIKSFDNLSSLFDRVPELDFKIFGWVFWDNSDCVETLTDTLSLKECSVTGNDSTLNSTGHIGRAIKITELVVNFQSDVIRNGSLSQSQGVGHWLQGGRVNQNGFGWIRNIWINDILEFHFLQRRTLNHDRDKVIVFEKIGFSRLSEHSITIVVLGWLDSEDDFGVVIMLELQVVSLELFNGKTFVLVGSELNSELLELTHFIVNWGVLGFLGFSSNQIDTLDRDIGLFNVDETVTISFIGT